MGLIVVKHFMYKVFFLAFTCLNVKLSFTVELCLCPHTVISSLFLSIVSAISNVLTVKWIALCYTSNKHYVGILVLMRTMIHFYYLDSRQPMQINFCWAPAQQKINNCLINVEWMPRRGFIKYIDRHWIFLGVPVNKPPFSAPQEMERNVLNCGVKGWGN